MKAVILAGGQGRRLLPYTATVPKPMMPVGNRPILEVVVQQLKAFGITEIFLATGYLEALIRSHFGDGNEFGIPIRYSRENEPLGTAGPLSLVRQYLTETFLLINGDVLTDIDFHSLIKFHHEKGNAVTVALARRQQFIDFGVVELDGDGNFAAWNEKPTLEYLVSTGIYIMDPKVLSRLSHATFINLPDFIVSLKKSGAGIGAYVHRGYWLDIGRPEDYERACRDAESLGLW